MESDSMANRIILHVGVPKTGTTALQSFLYFNEDNLEKHGFCYPHLLEELKDIPFSRERIRKNGTLFCWLPSNPTQEYWDRLCDYTRKKAEYYDVIISAEEIIHRYDIVLKRMIREFADIQVIIYIRRQDILLESYWNYLIKAGETDAEFNVFATEPPAFLHYGRVIKDIIGIVGENNIAVRVYEKDLLINKKIEDDFMNLLGVKDDFTKWNYYDAPNLRLSDKVVEIKRQFNKIGLNTMGYTAQGFSQTFEHLSKVLLDKYHDFGYFSQDSRREFLTQYEDDNSYGESTFFTDRSTFFSYEDLDNESEDKKGDEYVSEGGDINNLIYVFSGLIIDLDKRIVECENRIQNMKKHELAVIKSIAHGRRIGLFGAGVFGRRLLEKDIGIIDEVFDNNTNLQGTVICGKTIKSAIDIVDTSEMLIIIATDNTLSIEEQLFKFGLKKDVDFILAKEYCPSIVYDDTILL